METVSSTLSPEPSSWTWPFMDIDIILLSIVLLIITYYYILTNKLYNYGN